MKLQQGDRGTIETLRAITRDKNLYMRYTTLFMFDDGFTYRQISQVLGTGEKTAQRVIDTYRKGGIDEVQIYKYVGSTRALTEEQEQLLIVELTTYLYTECKEIVEYIESEFGIRYSVSGVCKLLKKLDFVYKKPKIVPGKANYEDQKKCRKKIIDLIENIEADSAVFFMDGVHPTHNSGGCYGWIRKGKEYELPANSGRQRININGAMNAVNPTEVYVDYTDSVNAQSTQRLIQKIKNKNRNKKHIYLITDNALYYNNKALKAWLEKDPRIEWVFLPPYSPNLNLIERLWRLLRKKIINGYYYQMFSEFKEQIINFFVGIENYSEELKSLMTIRFALVSQNL